MACVFVPRHRRSQQFAGLLRSGGSSPQAAEDFGRALGFGPVRWVEVVALVE